jgi:hypothetical protein
MMARRQPNPISESVDNYLKAILLLGGPEENRVASNALARKSWRRGRLRWSNTSGIAVFCYPPRERSARWRSSGTTG